MPRADLELVLKALDKIASSLPEDPGRDLFATQADALLEMARMVLNDETASDLIR